MLQKYWRTTEESNPIPVKRTQFSRLVAGPFPLHYCPKLVSKEGIEPSELLILNQATLPICPFGLNSIGGVCTPYTPRVFPTGHGWARDARFELSISVRMVRSRRLELLKFCFLNKNVYQFRQLRNIFIFAIIKMPSMH